MFKQLKSFIKQITPSIIWRIYYYIRKYFSDRKLVGPKIIRTFARFHPRANFVQIGSNDGKKHDPLHREVMRRDWHGILVEPVPYVFEKLKNNYSGVERVVLVNAAIAENEGWRPFYYVRESPDSTDMPSWYDELGSFDKEIVLKHVNEVPNLEKKLVTIEVPCTTFENICLKNKFDRVDLVHIDTEGYDYQIIKTINFEKWNPALIIYEHKHLSESDIGACERHLVGVGYRLLREGADTWCISNTISDRFVSKVSKYFPAQALGFT